MTIKKWAVRVVGAVCAVVLPMVVPACIKTVYGPPTDIDTLDEPGYRTPPRLMDSPHAADSNRQAVAGLDTSPGVAARLVDDGASNGGFVK